MRRRSLNPIPRPLDSIGRALLGIAFIFFANESSTAESPLTAIAVSTQGEIVVGSQSGIRRLKWPDLTTYSEIETEIENVERLTFNSDETILYAVGGTPGEFGLLESWAWPSGERIASRIIHDDVITSVLVIDANERFITSSIDGLVCFAGDEDRYLEGHSKAVLALCSIASLDLFVSAGRDRSIRVWDINSGQLKRTLNNHTADVRALRVKPADPERPNSIPMIASAAEDQTIRLWQPSIGRLVRFARLESSALDLVWSPDGKLIYAVCEDGCLRVIDPTTVRLIHTIEVSQDWIYTVANAPREDGVIIGLRDGSLKHITAQELAVAEK